jgi:cyanophycinase-like exopeptidase
MANSNLGLVVLLGSGETSLNGGRIFESVVRKIQGAPRIAILETPAGFELNSARVAGRVADFLRQRLQNYQPQIDILAARKRDTDYSPDNPELTQPLLRANLIFLGPGSPTYTVRQLHQSRAWHRLVARHRLGAALVLASAATIAASNQALPVYEIYKAGEDLHWRTGLDFFGAYGLSLVFVPHWNNMEGGPDLDTSRCFMGQNRFGQLLGLLPKTMTIIGIDEYTALIINIEDATCEVMGSGEVTVFRAGQQEHYVSGQTFPLTALGPFQIPDPATGLPDDVWRETLEAQAETEAEASSPTVPDRVMTLVEERQAARAGRDWRTADDLRQRIIESGWRVLDTPEGPRLEPQ